MELRYAILPLCILGAISGAISVSFNRRTGEPQCICIRQRVYNSTVMLLTVLLSIYCYCGKMTHCYKTQLPVVVVLNTLSQMCLTLGLTMQGYLPIFKSHSIIQSIKRIIEADNKLNINRKTHYQAIRWTLCVMLIIFNTIVIAVIVFDAIVWEKTYGFQISKYYLCDTILLFKLTVHATQFFTFLILLKERFNFLNVLLPLAVKGEHNYKVSLGCTHIINSDGKFSRSSLCKKEQIMVVKTPTIRELTQVHDDLYESALGLNNFYGFLIVIICFEVFVMFIQSVYSGIMFGTGIQKGSSVAFDARFQIALTICWTIYCLMLVAILSSLCEYTVASANAAGITAHRALLDESVDENIAVELTRLAHQIQHKNLRFTAFGLFNIDLTTLTQMIGAVTSYIIVAIQFEGLTPFRKLNIQNETTLSE